MAVPATDVAALADRGLQVDDRVRWRPTGRQVWLEARVTGLERDGSVGCVDDDGRARAVSADRLEVERRSGRAGVRRWVPLARPVQLALFADGGVARLPVRAGASAPRRRARR